MSAKKPQYMNPFEMLALSFEVMMGSEKAYKRLMRSVFEGHAHTVGAWAYDFLPQFFTEDTPARPFASLKVGDSESVDVEVHPHGVLYFARSVGDHNPLHFDKKYAAKSPFGEPIVHGMWSGSLFSAIFGHKLPGKGSVYRKQNLSFEGPARIGDVLTARVTITELDPKSLRIKFLTQVFNQDGKLVVDGDAVVYPAEKFEKKTQPAN